MLDEVERFMASGGLIHSGAGIVIACSGGPDSLALVDFVCRLQAKWQLRLAVAHFEHGIRGEASLADAAFVGDFCQKRGLAFFLESANAPAWATANGISLETAARELRYGFLRRLRQRLGFDYIATAHHADDQAETVLMHILRGAGTHGLMAMRAKSGDIIRPFLSLTKQSLLRYCAERGLEPRHDATNDIAVGLRNRLRLELLPQLEREYNPKIKAGLCQLADIAAAERDYLASEAARLWPVATRTQGGRTELAQAVWQRQPLAIKRELLRAFAKSLVGLNDVSFQQIEAMRAILEANKTGSRAYLAGGIALELSYGWLRLAETGKPPAIGTNGQLAVAVPGITYLPPYGLTIIATVQGKPPQHMGADEIYGDYDGLKQPLIVRTRRPGDILRLESGTKKLKDFFIDRKISRPERERWPIMSAGDDVLWVMGLRRTAVAKAGPSTTRIFYLQIKRKEDEK